MTSQQQTQTFVPIVLSQEEYNQILSQPAQMHQQLLQQIYQKKQQQAQPQQQQQVHPYQQFQEQTLNQSQNAATLINIPQIPTHPNQPAYLYQQGVQPLPQYVQYQYYQNDKFYQLLKWFSQIKSINVKSDNFIQAKSGPWLDQNIKNYLKQFQVLCLFQQTKNKYPNKILFQFIVDSYNNRIQIKIQTLIKILYNINLFKMLWSTYLFMFEICISLLINTSSAFFNWELVTNNYSWNSELWVVLILFLILNLFILTNPSYVTQKNNQKWQYWIHVILYVLLMQGLQTAVSGSATVFSWNTNYFYYFYLLICVEFISVRFAIKRLGVKKPIQEYLGYLIAAPVVTFFLELICQDYFFIYAPLLIWVIFVVLIGAGQIFIINRIVQKGYNKFQTKDVFAMAISFPILLMCPFYDEL